MSLDIRSWAGPARTRPIDASDGAKFGVLWTVCALGVVVALFFSPGGHFNVDEGVYHLMVRDLTALGDHGVWNGYEEFPSRELWLLVLEIYDGRLVSQYPEGFTLLALPFYRLLGYDGLFVMNALALCGVVWLTLRLARRLFADPGLAVNAGLVLVFATYTWEYAQASMPHLVGVLAVLGAVNLVVGALGTQRRVSLLQALFAGLLLGAGTTVRLDVFFAVPAVIIPFLFARPWRPWPALAALLGTVPALVWLALVNERKFGVLSPFSYGPNPGGASADVATYLFLAAGGCVALLLLWLATRPWGERRVRAHPRLFAAGLAALAGAMVLTPQGWALAGRFAEGAYQLVVDLRIRDLSALEGALSRGPGGAMVYIGSVKKSLLQSCPYLTVLVVAIWAAVRRPEARPQLALLSLVPVSYVGVFSYFAWHGGQGLNLRYFLPILPFTSILTAYAWRELAAGLSRRQSVWLAAIAAAIAALFFWLGIPVTFDLARQELLLLTVPMTLAAGVLALSLAYLAATPVGWGSLRVATVGSVTVALVWSGLVAFSYDMPRSYMYRHIRAELTESVEPYIEDDSILFTYSTSPFFGLLERRRVRLATPPYDDYDDFEVLARFHLEVGRPVYIWLDEFLAPGLAAHGLLTRLRTVPLTEGRYGRLVRLIAIAQR